MRQHAGEGPRRPDVDGVGLHAVDLVLPRPGGNILDKLNAVAPALLRQVALVLDVHGIAQGLPEGAESGDFHVVEGPPFEQPDEADGLQKAARERVEQVCVGDLPGLDVGAVEVVHAGDGLDAFLRGGRAQRETGARAAGISTCLVVPSMVEQGRAREVLRITHSENVTAVSS